MTRIGLSGNVVMIERESSGPAALVERLRKDAFKLRYAYGLSNRTICESAGLMEDAADALASPAPATDVICRCGYAMIPAAERGVRQTFVCTKCGNCVQVG